MATPPPGPTSHQSIWEVSYSVGDDLVLVCSGCFVLGLKGKKSKLDCSASSMVLF